MRNPRMVPVATVEEWTTLTPGAESDIYRYEALGIYNPTTEIPVQSKVTAGRVLARLFDAKGWDPRFASFPPLSLRSSGSKAGLWYAFVPVYYLEDCDDRESLCFDLREKQPHFDIFAVEAAARITDGKEIPLLPEWEHILEGCFVNGRLHMFDHSPEASAMIRDLERRAPLKRKRARSGRM
jgi:hypothetical protein